VKAEGRNQSHLLDGRRLPARLTSAEVAVVLGFCDHDIAQLAVSKLLNPLGKPARNSPKHFAAVDIVKAPQDREWLSTATRQISRYWQSRNEKKRASFPGGIDETTRS